MSVARNASATTSLPNPAALTPAGTGRSKADNVPPLAGRVFALSLLLLDTVSAGPLPPGGRNGGIQPDYEVSGNRRVFVSYTKLKRLIHRNKCEIARFAPGIFMSHMLQEI